MDRFDRYSMPSVSSWSRRLRNPAASDSRPEQTLLSSAALCRAPLTVTPASIFVMDKRSGRSISPHPWERASELGRVGGEQPDHPSCSLRPHDQNVLPQCAQ